MGLSVSNALLVLFCCMGASQGFTLQETGSILMTIYNSTDYQKYYYLSTYIVATWMEAYQFCKSSEMELLIFDTQDEFNFFVNHVSEASNFNKYYLNSEFKTARMLIYFGAVNKVLGSKNGWLFYETGKTIDYDLKWGTGQPNNVNNNQFCATLVAQEGAPAGYYMNDYQCFGPQYKYAFVCQLSFGRTSGYKPKF